MKPYQITRYHYDKNHIENALILSILKKDTDAYFWAFELYYSGFIHSLLFILWNIYYDFYFLNSPLFELYLHKKLHLNISSVDIGLIIANLLKISYSFTIFIKRQQYEREHLYQSNYGFTSQFDFNITSIIPKNIAIPIFKKNIINIILNNTDIVKNRFPDFIPYFRIIWTKQLWILLYLSNKNNKNNKNNNKIQRIYTDYNLLNLQKYQTIEINHIIPNFHILKNIGLYNAFKYSIINTPIELHQFINQPLTDRNILLYDWLYYAYNTPCWIKRIQSFNGIIDIINKKIIFLDEDIEELFNSSWNYEPDEQPLHIITLRTGYLPNIKI